MFRRFATLCALTALSASVFADAGPTYTRDIAQILFDHCVQCHRPGQIGPMSLMTFEEVRPWAKSIQREVAARNMPPFHAKGPLGRFLDDPRLESSEVQAVVAWVDNGAPQGNPADLPPPPEFDDDGWKLGEPDLIVTFPRVAVPADASEDYVWSYGDTVMPETVWFRAAQLKTNLPKQLHHANIFVTHPSETIPDGGGEVPPEKRNHIDRMRAMMAYLPGQEPMRFPDSAPGRLTQGWGFLMDAHYVPGDVDALDEVQIGFYRATGTVEAYNKELGLLAGDILIPPNKPDYVRSYTETFPEAAFITGFHVHMHYRGKSSVIRLRYPDQRIETILEIPDWDQAWQREYMLADPIAVPAGTVAEFHALWDNSANNPNNPDPNVWVREGMESKNEMYNGSIYYRAQKPLEKPIRVVDGREVE